MRRAPLVLLGCCLAGSAAGKAPREPSILLGGPRPPAESAPAQLDPRLPTGARVGAAARPAADERPYCSERRPLCVHAGRARHEDARRTLQALESAYARLVFALDLPAPPRDAGRGGSDAIDVYLGERTAPVERSDRRAAAADHVVVEADPPTPGAFSRASGYCRLRADDPVLLERAATLCLGELVALGLDASEPPYLRRAFATSLWWIVGAPTSLDAQAIDDAQTHPEAPIAGRERSPKSEGAAMFFEYLESVRGVGRPGALAAALFSAAASRSPRVGLDYENEPDVHDVIRHTLGGTPAYAAALVDFAVARAFAGDRDDGVHLPSLAWSGAFGRARFDWVLRASSLPRRVAVNPPIDSTGAVLLWLELDVVPPGGVGLRLEWERPVSFHFQLVLLGADGRELGRIDVPFRERAEQAEARVTRLDGARALLVVGTNLEGISASHPFDPDIEPFEPHGVLAYLATLPAQEHERTEQQSGGRAAVAAASGSATPTRRP